MMKKGVILEVTRSYIVVLTPEGEFLKGRKDREEYEIGSEVPVYPLIQKRKALFKSSNWGAGLAVAAVMMLCFALFAPFLTAPKAFAYVSIDVNPSVELTVDENNQVMAARPFNDDGETILRHIKKVDKRSVEEVTEDIITQMEVMGYVKKNKEIIIATVPAGNHSIHILTDLENKLQDRDLPIAYVKASPQEREAANEQGITTGKYIQKMRMKENEGRLPLKEGISPSEKENTTDNAVSREQIEKSAQNKQDKVEQDEQEDKLEAKREAEEAREKANKDKVKSEEKDREKQEKIQRKEKEEREKAEQKAKEEKEKAERKAKEEKEKAEQKAKEAQEKAERKAREEREKAEEKKREEQEKYQEQVRKKYEEAQKRIQKELEKRKKEQEKKRDDDNDEDDDD